MVEMLRTHDATRELDAEQLDAVSAGFCSFFLPTSSNPPAAGVPKTPPTSDITVTKHQD